MFRRERAGEEAGLPKVARAAGFCIEILGIASVDAAHPDGKGIAVFGCGDEVHVIGHEAVADEPDAGIRQMLGDEFQVDFAIELGAQNGLAVGAPLGEVVCVSGQDHSWISCHIEN